MPVLKTKCKACIYKIPEKGNYGQVIDHFTKALEIDSFHANVYYNQWLPGSTREVFNRPR